MITGLKNSLFCFCECIAVYGLADVHFNERSVWGMVMCVLLCLMKYICQLWSGLIKVQLYECLLIKTFKKRLCMQKCMHVQVHTASQNVCYKTVFGIKLKMKQLSLKCVFNTLRFDSFQNMFSKEILMKENYTRWFYLQETMTLV